MRKKVKVGLVQMSVGGDGDRTLSRALEETERAARRGARIVCLQELYRTKYFPQADRKNVSHLAETIPGPSTEAFARLARERELVVIVPLFERANGKLYNSAAVIDANGKLLPTYRKVHIPHDPLFYEKSYFAPGDRGFQVYKTRYASFAALICYDQWFPEAARVNTLLGAEILFYPTAIGFIAGQKAPEGSWLDAWVTIQRSHAIANGTHVVAVNRAGREGKLQFWGNSFACDSFGNVVAQAGRRDETLVAELNLGLNRHVRDGWGFLRNRRPDSYGLLTR